MEIFPLITVEIVADTLSSEMEWAAAAQ